MLLLRIKYSFLDMNMARFAFGNSQEFKTGLYRQTNL